MTCSEFEQVLNHCAHLTKFWLFLRVGEFCLFVLLTSTFVNACEIWYINFEMVDLSTVYQGKSMSVIITILSLAVVGVVTAAFLSGGTENKKNGIALG